MLEWFQKVAPIRTKFRVLLANQTALTLVTSTTMILTVEGVWNSHLATFLVVASSLVTILSLAIAAKVISGPYVTTVERMEALAEGDLSSPVCHTEYQDCVGRLTRALAVFRNQALALQQSSTIQQEVVATMTASLKRLAMNELSYRMDQSLPEEYAELREHFNSAAQALDSALCRVSVAAAEILGGANETRAASDELSVRTERQAAALEEGTASLTQTTGIIVSNAEAAVEASGAVRDVQAQARRGNEVVLQAIEAMAKIQSSSEEISQIVSVIDGIAFQTNLLALNAGVEAARAGESGKGFAVVATEVRALAQRSAEAATQIRRLISASTSQVQDGVALVDETGKALTAIALRVDKTVDRIDSIAKSSTIQSEALTNVMDSISEMDRMTQQNAAMVEESNAASRQLASQSASLSEMVSAFTLSTGKVLPLARKVTPIAGRKLATISAATAVAVNAAIADGWSEF